ncbi:MAG: DUF4132 domain-containing protein, partial [Verrucomicrobiales bacterium]|nr:DUF4132 domain-containing protein [Verrucomicrobiales bacterium]
ALRAQSSLDPALAPEWEGMLKRKTGEVREHALALLVKLSDAQALDSADRLLSARDALTRTGGLELLRQLVAAGRVCEAARQRVEAFQSRVVKISPHDQPHVDAVLSASAPRLSLEDALGLAPAALRTPPLIPRLRPGPFASPTSPALAAALEVEFEKHSATRFRLRNPFDDAEFDADLTTAFSHAAVPERGSLVPSVESRVPLRSTWVDWLRQRGPDLRDPDGFELLRLLARKFARWRGSLTESALPAAERQRLEPFFGPDWAKSDSQKRWATDFMPWLLRWDPPQGDWPGFVLDGYESTLALIHDGPLNQSSTCSEGWLHVARLGRVLWPERWRPAHHARLWRLLRWRDDMAREGRARITLPVPAESPRSKVLAALQQAQTTVASDPCWRGSFDDGVAAFATGGATEADLLDLLLSNRDTLRAISQRPLPRWLPECPALRPVLDRATERLLEIELARGDTPTPATRPCLCLRSLEGMSAFARLLAALRDQPFERQSGAGQDRRSVFSDLLGRCHPAPDETPERFAHFIKDFGLTPERLVEAAVFAPQWARHVETATTWSGLAQGIAWIHAHTKVADGDLSPTDQAAWKAEMAQHSPLSGDDLMDGAVDVTWFQRLYQELGPRRWTVLEEAAKYASTGSGHARARLFAQALRNNLDEADLIQRVRRQRQQDAVRALGLLRLPARGRDRKLFERYQVLQEFLRGSANAGAQRRASEKRAFEIGLANLARTAGFQTPLRLLWAMEARAVDDLADGQLSVTAKEVTVSLSIDVWGDAITTITRAGKPLPKLPAALSKHAGIAALRLRKIELKHQASRIRTALESMMNQGETVLGADLPGLMRHPLLAPMLRDLVLVGEGIAGYPVQEGRVLQRHDGSQEAVKSRELLRLAHPVDLLPAREWSAWQRECFARERIQPFKQVFREWYPLTDTERGEVTQSRRYAGHQLWPRQALAILGAHGWIHRDGSEVCRILHAEGLVARLEFEQSWGTPADLEGLTVAEVCFTRRDARDRLRLEDIPARCFSEVMRELDLAVSVAHCGGVDPEASAASVEGRGALVRETATLLGLDGVTVHERHVEIRGQLGRYTVHLGSGIAHRVPGGMLSLVAVRSQQRGRLFLPFVDDDPASAEILSKVLLLARDTEIRDPAIQAQLRRP